MTMAEQLNRDIAARLDEVAARLREQGANLYRVHAYEQAAARLRGLAQPVSKLFRREGLGGLERLPDVGPVIARAIRELVLTGRLPMLERLRGESDPLALLASVPGIGRTHAQRLHHELGIGSLEQLEAAAHDGRLATLAGFGAKRLAGIRDALATRLGRVRPPPDPAFVEPPVREILAVDHEYRTKAAAGELRRITPRRFNPLHEAWLPILHTARGDHQYTALFSNTARAHALARTHDWVVVYADGDRAERQYTVVTAPRGPLKGKRVVRGREAECLAALAARRHRGAVPSGATAR
jgi:DNA polymerase (family 10)